MVDSGVTTNADLANAAGVSPVVYRQSFVPGTTDAQQLGHATHIAGSIAGDAANSIGPQFYFNMTGVAPSANIINLRLLGQNEAAWISSDCRHSAGDRTKGTFNIRALNLSLGRPVFEATR